MKNLAFSDSDLSKAFSDSDLSIFRWQCTVHDRGDLYVYHFPLVLCVYTDQKMVFTLQIKWRSLVIKLKVLSLYHHVSFCKWVKIHNNTDCVYFLIHFRKNKRRNSRWMVLVVLRHLMSTRENQSKGMLLVRQLWYNGFRYSIFGVSSLSGTLGEDKLYSCLRRYTF